MTTRMANDRFGQGAPSSAIIGAEIADNLPKKIVYLLGKINVGIAKMKITTKPKYKNILKINDLINCIKNLSIWTSLVFF